ncbi:MAG TPA: hypothetical protein VLW44_22230 [Streptosporangiaceae bacterium]|nr:hypothetical protein [Streptosporangiaceae bacterium]
MKLTMRLAAVAAGGLLAAGCGSAGPSAAPPSPSPATAPATASATAPVTAPAPTPFAYQPLFPFGSLAAVRAWQASYASGGHAPWHLNPGLTALAFTQGYLGFTRIDKVAALRISGGDAHVTVGFHRPDGHVSAAAVVHLVQYGSGKNVPWEVVGTDDTTLTLDVPAYGGTAISPVRIGGKITGVDESLRAEVHRLGSAGPVGSYCCHPAGGQATPWSFSVTFHAPAGQVITIVVHTGGHVAAVERFAITGVRVG